MRYILDTNICIYLIKRKPFQLLERFQTHLLGDICISSITVAELQYGVEKSQHQHQNQAALNLFLAPLETVNFDTDAAQHFGQIRTELERLGTPIGAYDFLIAAHARSLDLILVTNNTREFNRVSNLRVENWTT